MKPALRPIRAQPRPISTCQLCAHLLQQPAHRRAFVTAAALQKSAFAPAPSTPRPRRQPARRHGAFSAAPRRAFASTTQLAEHEPEFETPDEARANAVSVQQRMRDVEKAIRAIYTSNKVEDDSVVLEILTSLEIVAKRTIAIRSGQPPPQKLNLRKSSAGAILSLDSDEAPDESVAKPAKETTSNLPSLPYLSSLASELLKHDTVFISADILSKFVDLQWLLGKPRAIPELFYLYANKPVPQLGSSPPKYTKPWPKSYKSAIPPATAEKALAAALAFKDLPLAIRVIDTTYTAPAWRSYKFVSKVLPPGIVVGLLPFGIYQLASEISLYSGFLDPFLFKCYAFAGISTYFLCTGTLGYVAMTTWNDHHVRVVWRPGMPLIDRWLREDERAALDKIAMAWGFKEDWRRGDEEGEDWEGLRRWCLIRGMVLDKSDLMPGMNPPKD